MKDWDTLAAHVPYEPRHARRTDRPRRVVLSVYAVAFALCAIVLVWRFR